MRERAAERAVPAGKYSEGWARILTHARPRAAAQAVLTAAPARKQALVRAHRQGAGAAG